MRDMTSDPQPTPPGWYAVDAHTERWWDGVQWGPQARPRVVRQAPAPVAHGRIITRSPIRTSHTFHLLMTVLTCGMWAPIWFLTTVLNKASREKSVTRY